MGEPQRQKTLHFSIQGELITRIARESLYQSNDLDRALRILKAATMTDIPMSDGDHLMMCLNILEGRAKITGVSGTASYNVTADKPEPWNTGILNWLRKITEENKEMKHDLHVRDEMLYFISEQLLSEDKSSINREWNDIYGNDETYPSRIFNDVDDDDLSDHMSAWNRPDIPDDSDPEERMNAVNESVYEVMAKPAVSEAMLDRLETERRGRRPDDYGWLEPNGTFHPVPWGEHQKWAADYIEERLEEFGLDEHAVNIRMMSMTISDTLEQRGWVLLHSTYLGTPSLEQRDLIRLTKKQREYIYDYYMSRGLTDKANEIMRSGGD